MRTTRVTPVLFAAVLLALAASAVPVEEQERHSLRGTGCSSTEAPYLSNEIGEDELDGCGGLPFDEIFTATGTSRHMAARMPRASGVNDADGNKLYDDLDLAYAQAPGDRRPVIVTFRHDVATADGVARARDVAPAAVVDRTFTIVPAFSGSLTQLQAERIAALEQVRQIELDRPGTPELGTATGVMGANAAVDSLGVTGSLDGDPELVTTADVGIAVLDSGFHTGHVDLAGKLTAWVDLGSGGAEPYDNNGHGTHVASITAGWGRGDPAMRGVAPGAGIVGIKIDGGSGSASNALAGFQWIVEERERLNIRVATISYGFGTATDGTTALELAVDAAWDAGIVVFKSNGNSGPGHGTMTVPAAARGIIATGSLFDPFSGGSLGFGLSSFSSRGPTTDGRIKPDLTAPGDTITAAAAGTPAGYTSKSGTSMASPFAAGTAALMIAANPALSPDEVREILFATAEDFGAAGADNDFGHGRIRVDAAVAEALRRAGAPVATYPAVPVPVHDAVTLTADLTGRATTVVEVTSSAFPLSVTVLGPQLVAAIEISGVGSQGVPAVHTGASRHDHQAIRNPTPGTYEITAYTTPGSSVVIAVSHSVATG